MSSWTLLIAKGRLDREYEYSNYDTTSRWDATVDLAATMDADDRIDEWKSWYDHVCGYVAHQKNAFGQARSIMQDYSSMIDNAVVLSTDNTSDCSTALYYKDPMALYCNQFESKGYPYSGDRVLNGVNATYDINAKDPFHTVPGFSDEVRCDTGENRLTNDGDNQ